MSKFPAIILVKPQMGENIGAAARVMKNFGFYDLRIVEPRDGWPNPKALEMSASAKEIVEGAMVFDELEEAISDLQYIYAATARRRDMAKPTISSKDIGKGRQEGISYGIMFGAEKSGLTNEEVVLADEIVSIPVDPAYTSLNLAQSVAVLCYEWFSSGEDEKLGSKVNKKLASKSEIVDLFEHLESELDNNGFFKVPEKRAQMVSNIRNMFQRANLRSQEVQTLRGIIRSLSD